MLELVVIAVVVVLCGLLGYWSGRIHELRRMRAVFSDTRCFGCGRHICETCHDKVAMPFGQHRPEDHAPTGPGGSNG